ncbi:MAG: DUF4091 domain-containing protein, partial [Clostridia bacterium]|nr:DUF4091 domain-containing protein [Clostridia bacterium]
FCATISASQLRKEMLSMKKLSIVLLLLLLTVCVAVACNDAANSKDETNGTTTAAQTTDAETTTEAAETEPPVLMGSDGVAITDEELHGWLAYGGNLTYRDHFTVSVKDSIAIGMAKNEMEGFQYVLASNVDYKGLRCEVSVLTDGSGNTLEGTVHVAWNMYTLPSDFLPFALMEQDNPYQGGTFDVEAHRSKTLYVKYITDINSIPGTYTGKLEIKQGDTVLKSHDISVTVWNIYYDEATECLTPSGYGHNNNPENGYFAPDSAPGVVDEPKWYTIYADYLLANRLSPSRIPYDTKLTEPLAAKYLNNPRMNFVNFYGPYWEDLTLLEEQYTIAEANGWLDKINLQICDEPVNEDHLLNSFAFAERIREYFPSTRMGGALLKDQPLDGRNVVERYADYSTVHILKKQMAASYPYLWDSCLKLKEERGDDILWYVCGDEPQGQIDVLPRVAGTLKNIMYWQMFLYDCDGMLFWSTDVWGDLPDFWARDFSEFKPNFKELSKMNFGNGVLVVWDPLTKEPTSTLGLEAVRDGVEDFQLMRMAEEILGTEAVKSYVRRVTASVASYTTDPALLAQVRSELAEALMAAMEQ